MLAVLMKFLLSNNVFSFGFLLAGVKQPYSDYKKRQHLATFDGICWRLILSDGILFKNFTIFLYLTVGFSCKRRQMKLSFQARVPARRCFSCRYLWYLLLFHFIYLRRQREPTIFCRIVNTRTAQRLSMEKE